MKADDNYSDADSKIDVGGDTDDNSAHYMDDDVGVGSPDSDAAHHDVSAESGHSLKVKGYSDVHNHSHSANSGGSGGSKRKKKTRTVFSRSQVTPDPLTHQLINETLQFCSAIA